MRCVGKTTCTRRYVLELDVCYEYWPNKRTRIALRYFLQNIIQSVQYVRNIAKVPLQVRYNKCKTYLYFELGVYCS